MPAADLYETIDQHGDLDKFQKMLKRANLEDNLEKKPWTVFAPNDRAVDKANDNPLKAALLALDENGVTKYHLSDIAAWSSAELSVFGSEPGRGPRPSPPPPSPATLFSPRNPVKMKAGNLVSDTAWTRKNI